MDYIENAKSTLQDVAPISLKKASQENPPQEGKTTRAVENITAKVPSMVWLGLAVGSMALSAGLEIFGKKKEYGNFVGLWAPSFLLIGIYNKIVKEEPAQKASA